MTNDTTFDKIEAWLSGELPEAEARAFEAELATDASLAREVERHRRVREALDRLAEQSLQHDFALWRTSLDDIPSPPEAAPVRENASGKTPEGLRWLTAAAFLLALAGIVWYFIPATSPEPNEVNKEEITPPQQKSDVPVADVTPSAQPAEPNTPDRPQQPRQADSGQLIAKAKTRLGDLRASILQQYGQTMGDEEDENPLFTAGLKAFKNNETTAAKQNFLQIPSGDPYFPSAQEILASVYFNEKNYAEAARCYEHFARQSTDPATDWRLVQFYLADYGNRKADFWKKMDEILDPAHPHRFRKEAETLKNELSESGISRR